MQKIAANDPYRGAKIRYLSDKKNLKKRRLCILDKRKKNPTKNAPLRAIKVNWKRLIKIKKLKA